MNVSLNIAVLDVTYKAAKADTVQVALDGGTLTAVTKNKDGNYLQAIPAGAKTIKVHVEGKGFWPVDQTFKYTAGVPPTLAFDPVQAINIRNWHGYGCFDGKGGFDDYVLDIFVVLGQIKDAAAKVNDAFTATKVTDEEGIKISANLDLVNLPLISTPILNKAGTAMKRLNTTRTDVTPKGKLYFVERIDSPKLIAIYRPAAIATHPVKNPQDSPIDFHLFFHPFIPSEFSRTYPFSDDYIDLIYRYLLGPSTLATGTLTPNQKQMIHQNDAVGAKSIFVFPVGSPTKQMGTLNSQAATLRLLQEINYWVQRMDGVPYPLQPVGKLAMSCFSAGVRFLSAVLAGRKVASFYDETLKEVYLLDGVFAPNWFPGITVAQWEAAKVVARQETKTFNNALIAWWRKGASNRAIRVYTQAGSFWDDLIGAAGSPNPSFGPSNAKESEITRATILYVPSNSFWITIDPTMDSDFVHQLIPARFMEHAMSLNAF